jgi:hypothetical protein
MSRPDLHPGEWVEIGPVSAVVCRVHPEASKAEVVYLDERDRAINEDVRWVDDHWEFAVKGPSGGYADKSDRLGEFVAILRRGKLR